MSCQYKVKPLPFAFCKGCALNGCYPWNKNPILCCHRMGGLAPIGMILTQNDEPNECLDFKKADDWWNDFIESAKKEAAYNEETREQAIKGEVYTNQKELSDLSE